jgi:hypothetical protein
MKRAAARGDAAGYGPFRHLAGEKFEPQVAPMDSEDETEGILEVAERFESLFREDVSLGPSISWLVGLRLRSLEGSRSAGQIISTVLDLLSDGLLPDGFTAVKVDSRGLWVRHDSREFPLREISDGHRTVAALVLDIVRGLYEFYGRLNVHKSEAGVSIRSPGIVLIDEIDAHLHVSWQKRIGGWLTKHFPRIQFIVTTHSPYICQSADPGGLFRLPGPGEKTGPRKVDESLYRRIIYGSGDDAALSELFGLDSPYSERAEELRRRLIVLEEKIFSGSATRRERNEYQTVLRMTEARC